ncbi:MAG: L-threonylcarbamoyladenylate synthase [Thiotrichales bacterium]|nr:MAG: L-threonylcarbamoyladenylate synthase [Thiotrichales bacterium]
MASEFAVRYAIHCVRRGGVIAYPTETVYGLGCDPMCSDAVNVINHLKGRDARKGLILLASGLEQLDELIDVSDRNQRATIVGEPEPTSWIVPAKDNAPPWITGGRNTIAIRITTHPLVIRLCDQLGHALVSTSANPAGRKPALNPLQLHRYFDGLVDAMLVSNHNCSGRASKIRDLASRQLLRK